MKVQRWHLLPRMVLQGLYQRMQLGVETRTIQPHQVVARQDIEDNISLTLLKEEWKDPVSLQAKITSLGKRGCRNPTKVSIILWRQ